MELAFHIWQEILCLTTCLARFPVFAVLWMEFFSFLLIENYLFQALDADVREYLTEQTGKVTYTRVDEVCRKLWVRGIHLGLVSKFLISKGMWTLASYNHIICIFIQYNQFAIERTA